MTNPPWSITNLASDGTTINASDVTNPDGELLDLVNNLALGVNEAEQFKLTTQGSTPATPGAGLFRLYFKSTGLYHLNSSGTETKVGAALDTYSELLRIRSFS